MKVILSGLSCCGKSTVFKALVGKAVQAKSLGRPRSKDSLVRGKIQLNLGTLELKDERLERLGQLLHSEKVTYPKLSLIDIVNLAEQSSKGIAPEQIREFDLLGVVLGVFSGANPVADLTNIEQEFILADLQLLQNRIKKINKEGKARPKKEEEPELLLLQRLAKALEAETLLEGLNLNLEEQKMIAGFQLLTLKPMIVVANISEEQVNQGGNEELESKLQGKNRQFISLCAKLEAEIAELTEEERPKFLQEMGLAALSRDNFTQLCFQAQEKILFFTVVGKEARAWPIPKGATALEAAGCVHSDMQRGFIRAEVINYKDFLDCGSFATAKEKGLLRLESKVYPVQDGDIINFKFNV